MRVSLIGLGLALALTSTLGSPVVALAEEALAPLPTLTLDGDATSVLGVSSGGYMATQLAVAYPSRFHGLGVFAAGPWGCAQGALGRALGQCMKTRLGLPDLSTLAERYADYREHDRVGATDALATQRVYLWHGEQDPTVKPALSELLARQYRGWLDSDDQLRRETTANAAHGWPVDSEGSDSSSLAHCSEGGSPYLLDCGVDGAGRALEWFYGELQPADPKAPGELRTFDQSPFEGGRSIDDVGYVFVPEVCDTGTECRLVVALHGCGMGREQVGETFVRETGLNAWAATNALVVLYPQAAPSLPNPQGCWDWWGYAESTWQPKPLHDTRQGRQVQALMGMIAKLTGQEVTEAP
ncbi:alpha/beta hydrolase-fold protein [Litchfieldella xinjiangensis]|uniref:extracellular catalytic domain type 2 short-chain-length polyhydroxyalkanoate depolymerase n=1 Tax=Litchfieldella xinjiangensis TaxID=1166948 RepID=UPI0005BA6117|nr:PHB depolymerase family esterase [Halomonas xinjiangensis]